MHAVGIVVRMESSREYLTKRSVRQPWKAPEARGCPWKGVSMRNEPTVATHGVIVGHSFTACKNPMAKV